MMVNFEAVFQFCFNVLVEVELCFPSRKFRSINFQFIDCKAKTLDLSGEAKRRKQLISGRSMNKDIETELNQLVSIGKFS